MNEDTRGIRLSESLIHDIGLIAGPVLAIGMYLYLARFPELGEDGRRLAGVATLMATWWVTEAIPLAATALVPIVSFPVLGILGITETGAQYGHPLIFLFMGGLMMGKGLERWGAHRRLALWIILLVGTSPRRIVAGVMLAAALLSAFVSNTATAMMMLPIVGSIGLLASGEGGDGRAVEDADPESTGRFHTCLLLALAYGCSIGGIATIMGTPPNGFMAGFMRNEMDIEMTYARWLGMGVPLSAVLLPAAWAYLVFVAMRVRIRTIPGGKAHIRERLADLGSMGSGEILALSIFSLTALLWVTHGWIESRLGLAAVDDGAIAIFGALLMFAVPVDRARTKRVLSWDQAEKIQWGILILFGGGLALAQGVTGTGFDTWIGERIAQLGDPGELGLLAGTSTLIVFLTEITSDHEHDAPGARGGGGEHGDLGGQARRGGGGVRVVRVHAPRRDTTQRDRLLDRADHDPSDGPCRSGSEPHRDRGHLTAGLAGRGCAAGLWRVVGHAPALVLGPGLEPSGFPVSPDRTAGPQRSGDPLVGSTRGGVRAMSDA